MILFGGVNAGKKWLDSVQNQNNEHVTVRSISMRFVSG